jgi:hypothetical protein
LFPEILSRNETKEQRTHGGDIATTTLDKRKNLLWWRTA